MIFVNSMSDLFHQEVPESFILRVAATMRVARWHTYQVLTKRSERLRELLSGPLSDVACEAHIWWGVSVEDRKYGLPGIADLQAATAAVRFLSVEPLLEDIGELPLEGISWVIVGGESGPGARPMKEHWVLSIREQCEAANVPFFFKQWGGVRKKAAGRMLRGRTYDGLPKRVRHPTPPAQIRLQQALEVERGELAQVELAQRSPRSLHSYRSA
jgi:protein gp37